MARSKFAEKAYEIAYCAELYANAASGLPIYSPTQVLEALLGFDAAADPSDTHPIWSALRLPRPKGIQLLPTHWALPADHYLRLPHRPVSLILQFKCPEFLHGPQAAQWHLWGSPYYRFARTTHQQSLLARLERDLAGACIVRYAAPAFHLQGELEEAQLRRQVIELSGHVSPRELEKHKIWTYLGPGLDGRPNPSGRPRPFEAFETLLAATINLPEPDQVRDHVAVELSNTLRTHVESLAASVRNRNPALRAMVTQWGADLVARTDIPTAALVDLMNFASIQTAVTSVGAAWAVVDSPGALSS